MADTLIRLLTGMGMTTPLRRFVITFLAGLALEFFTKPSWAFDEKGGMRPFVLLSNGGDNSTFLPVGATPGMVATMTSLFL